MAIAVRGALPAAAAPKQDAFVVDMGDPGGETGAVLEGWGAAEGPPATIPTPSGDRTLRAMTLRGEQSLSFSNVAHGDYRLTTEVGDGICDDSFQILVDDEILYVYQAQDSLFALFGPHVVDIPRRLVKHHQLTVTFRNIATDTCGLAGVYNVLLERIGPGQSGNA